MSSTPPKSTKTPPTLRVNPRKVRWIQSITVLVAIIISAVSAGVFSTSSYHDGIISKYIPLPRTNQTKEGLMKFLVLCLAAIGAVQLITQGVVFLEVNGAKPPTQEEIKNGSVKVNAHGELAIGVALALSWIALTFLCCVKPTKP